MRGAFAVLFLSSGTYLVWGQFYAGIIMIIATLVWSAYVIASKLPR